MFWLAIVLSVLGFFPAYMIGLFSARDMRDAVITGAMAVMIWGFCVFVFSIYSAKTGMFF